MEASELTECQAKCGRLEASLHLEPPQPETSWSREVEVEKENQERRGAAAGDSEALEQRQTPEAADNPCKNKRAMCR